MSRKGFNFACRASYDLLHMVNSSNIFGRVPIKLRLFFAMIESADTSGRVKESVHGLARKLPVTVNDQRLYKARDELVADGLIIRTGTDIYINPDYIYKGLWKEGAWYRHKEEYETMRGGK